MNIGIIGATGAVGKQMLKSESKNWIVNNILTFIIWPVKSFCMFFLKFQWLTVMDLLKKETIAMISELLDSIFSKYTRELSSSFFKL